MNCNLTDQCEKPGLAEACVACHGDLAYFGMRAAYPYHWCAACGTIQLHPLPTPDALEAAYRLDYATAGHCRSDVDEQTGAACPYYEELAAALDAHHAGTDLLEIGAGWGGLCEVLLARSYRYRGIEPSEAMAAHCRARGLPVECTDLWGVDTVPRDALVLSAVFEHLVEHDRWLGRASALLKTGGLLVSLQPTARFASFMGNLLRLGMRGRPLPQLHQVFCPPWHTVLFSIRGMQALLGRHGFELVEVRLGPQARGRGLEGVAQRSLSLVNRAAWPLFGTAWPLTISHIFVFRKSG